MNFSEKTSFSYHDEFFPHTLAFDSSQERQLFVCGRAEERTHTHAHVRKYGTTEEHVETKRAEPRRAPRVAATARLPELALFECEQETQTK